jgi:hypothetical protein
MYGIEVGSYRSGIWFQVAIKTKVHRIYKPLVRKNTNKER